VTLDLHTRDGWPDDLRILVEKYPRDVWRTHANLGELAQFWLERHADFRRLGATLDSAAADLREGRLAHDQFGPFFAPRLQLFLGHLEGHHQIEDFSFFPVFRAADARLAHGFDVLEGDHQTIHAEMQRVAEATNNMLRMAESHVDKRRAAVESYSKASETLLRFLARHLDDEEDLVVPIILEQSERELFGG